MRSDTFDSAGVRIHYLDDGEGEPIVLVHGFAASAKANWVLSGWFDTLRPIRRVIALDCRGHGESEKPHDSAPYASDEMASDVVRLMDHLRIEKADLFGYSMGGAISIRALLRYPERFRSVVLGGVGDVRLGPRRRAGMAEAMRARDPAMVSEPVARDFRTFAERMGNDLEALAAMQGAPRGVVASDALASLRLPVLIVNGADDAIVSNVDALAAAIPGARLVKIAGKDHLSVVPDAQFKETVVQFLQEPR